MWSVFQRGWPELPEVWDNKDAVHALEPALDIRSHLHDLINKEPSIEFDVMIYSSKLLHSKLVVSKVKGSLPSVLCNLLERHL